jgi:hypothetical protein
MRAFAILILLSAATCLKAQNIDLMMQAWYWDYFQNGNYGTWINQLNSKTTELKNAGFKHIWLPPLSRSSTTNNVSNGYNPMDLFDLGQYGPACAWGTRTQLNTLINNFNNNGLSVVSDMIYNHRDGGKPEKNEAVKYFMTNSANPVAYPSDRVFFVLPLGSANPGNNGAGDYYIKVKSKAMNNSLYGAHQYKFYAKTNSTTTYLGQVNETEPNGGLPCGQPSNAYSLGQDVLATLFDFSGCYTDEFKITLTASNFNATDDTLRIYMVNAGSAGYSDHYIFGIYSAPRNTDIVNELEYWTYTNFNNLPSGRGGMNYNAFRPNDVTSNSGGITENFSWPLQTPLFFYDYDQNQTVARDSLNAWTKWQLQQGIKGLRMDAVKHFDADYVSQLMNYLYNNGTIPEMVVGEFFDYNAGTLNGWVNDVYNGMNSNTSNAIKVRAFDFALRGTLKSACDAFGFDVRDVFTSGMVEGVGANGFNVVTFVDNHDIRHEGNGIINDAKLAYSYILTNNQIGAPCVFYPDYYGVQVGNTPLIDLKDEINDLVFLHKNYIYGSTDVDYLSRKFTPYAQEFISGFNTTTLVYQLKPNTSGKNVIVAINFAGDTLKLNQAINTGWGAGPGTIFTDMLGISPNQTQAIQSNNRIYIQIPPRSYTVYVQGVNTPLPVELSDFQAFPLIQDVLLKWNTLSEVQFSHYEIERSVGNEQSFQPIGIQVAKNETGPQKYDFTDRNAPLNTPLYYRLKMWDTDGRFEYSPIRQATLERRPFDAWLLPNPVAQQGTLHINNLKTQTFKLEILDAFGRLVWQEQTELESVETDVVLPHLSAGMYQVNIQGEAAHMVLNMVQL